MANWDLEEVLKNNPELYVMSGEHDPYTPRGDEVWYDHPKAPKRTEHEEQVELFKIVERNLIDNPDLAYLFAVPNGGYRHKKTASAMKAEGQKAGVPDILFPVPMGDYVGLAIEMKVKPNKLTDNQERWLSALEQYGWQTAVCYSADEAWEIILGYLSERVFAV